MEALVNKIYKIHNHSGLRFTKFWEVHGPDVDGLEIFADRGDGLYPVLDGERLDGAFLEDLGFYAMPGGENMFYDRTYKVPLRSVGGTCVY